MKTILVLCLVGAYLASQNLRTQEPVDYSFVQLKEIRNNANHLLTISTDEYIYKMQYSGENEENNLNVPGKGELATYNLNVDGSNTHKPDTNGMNEILDLVKQMGDTAHSSKHGKHQSGHKKHHAGHKMHSAHKRSAHPTHRQHGKQHLTHHVAAIQMRQSFNEAAIDPVMIIEGPEVENLREVYPEAFITPEDQGVPPKKAPEHKVDHAITDSIKQLIDSEIGEINAEAQRAEQAELAQQSTFIQLEQSKGQRNYKYVAIEASPAKVQQTKQQPQKNILSGNTAFVQKSQSTPTQAKLITYVGHEDGIQW